MFTGDGGLPGQERGVTSNISRLKQFGCKRMTQQTTQSALWSTSACLVLAWIKDVEQDGEWIDERQRKRKQNRKMEEAN
jgi:hypothetical protein